MEFKRIPPNSLALNRPDAPLSFFAGQHVFEVSYYLIVDRLAGELYDEAI